MVSATDGWIVGEETILHWDGQTWRMVEGSTGLSAYVDGVDTAPGILSTDAGWAPTFTIDNYTVNMVSSTDGWIGGSHEWGYEGLMFFRRHWDGVSWSLEMDWGWPLRSFAMVSPTDGWVVGGGTWRDHWNCLYRGGEFMRWDGVNWTAVDNPGDSLARFDELLNGVAMVSATDGWVVGEGSILRYTAGVGAYRTYARRTGQPPTVDGNLSDWGQRSPMILNRDTATYVATQPPGGPPPTPADNSAELRAPWTGANLYFAIFVRDEPSSTTAPMSRATTRSS